MTWQPSCFACYEWLCLLEPRDIYTVWCCGKLSASCVASWVIVTLGPLRVCAPCESVLGPSLTSCPECDAYTRVHPICHLNALCSSNQWSKSTRELVLGCCHLFDLRCCFRLYDSGEEDTHPLLAVARTIRRAPRAFCPKRLVW
jgi:hypothetical protein